MDTEEELIEQEEISEDVIYIIDGEGVEYIDGEEYIETMEEEPPPPPPQWFLTEEGCWQAFILGIGVMVPFVAVKIGMALWRRGTGEFLD